MDILNQFGVKPILLAAQVVNFLILLFILKKFLYKPVLKVLEERKKRIENSLKNAEEIERRLRALSEEEQKRITDAVAEGEKIIKQATDAGQQILEDVSKKREAILNQADEDAKRLYETQKEKMMIEVKEYVSNLVLSVIQKVTGKILTKKDQKEIVEKEVRNLS